MTKKHPLQVISSVHMYWMISLGLIIFIALVLSDHIPNTIQQVSAGPAGVISGTVYSDNDNSTTLTPVDAPKPNHPVAYTNISDGTGVWFNVMSDASGKYIIDLITPGSYILSPSGCSNYLTSGPYPVPAPNGGRVDFLYRDCVPSSSAGTPPPASLPPPSSPAVSNAWFQVAGRVHSQAAGIGSIKVLVPAGKYFNTLATAVTSVKGGTNFGSGSVAASPRPLAKQYSIDSAKYSYATFKQRVQTTPLTWIDNPPISGTYQCSGTLPVNTTWTINPNQYYVVFVENDLEINENIEVRPGGFLTFFVNGDIRIKASVTKVEGIYYAEGRIITK